MKYKKFKAFTLAEVMILLLTLSILMAAFAPVFTRRYSNASTDDVWAFVSSDDEGDAYYDTPNKNYTAQAFVGLTPVDGAGVLKMSTDGSNNILYSKIVVAASNDLAGSAGPQNQIQFRYGDSEAGTVVGSLFAGNKSILLGGPYKDVHNTAWANTAYGVGALEKIISATSNSALGYKALNKMESGFYNTAVGHLAGGEGDSKLGYGNTFVGSRAGLKYTDAAAYNTIVGNQEAQRVAGSNNTFVGNSYRNQNIEGSDNTAVGHAAMNSSKISGSGNTALGFGSMANITSGSYNTAVGAYSCNNVESGSYKTCIGYNAGSNSGSLAALYTGDYERIFIGSSPVNSVDNLDGAKTSGHPRTAAGAVLEVYNLNSKSTNASPIDTVGNSAVVVNGNLIVRGNSYFEIPIARQVTALTTYWNDNTDLYEVSQRGLVLQRLFNETGIGKVFAGYDGYQRRGSSNEVCGDCEMPYEPSRHAFGDLRPNCICTAVSTAMTTGNFRGTIISDVNNLMDVQNTRTTSYNIVKKGLPVSTSYDWFTKASNDNAAYWCSQKTSGVDQGETFARYFWNPDENGSAGAFYIDRSIKTPGIECQWPNDAGGNCWNATVILERRHNEAGYGLANPGVDLPYAHARMEALGGYFSDNQSCCPILIDNSDCIYQGTCVGGNNYLPWRSDKRLKNVGGKFVAGLDEIRRLNAYNYTFKDDKNQTPHVGVIAQDLRLIFPNAVTKDENGYYKIRLDEMFYAAINAVKTLHTNVQSLAMRIAKDKQRVAQLKKDNTELNARLDNLADELTKLEEAKRK